LCCRSWFAGSAYVIADNASTFVGQLSGYGPKLNDLIARSAHLFGVYVAPTVDDLLQQLDPTRYLGDVAKVLQSFGSNAVFVLIYLGFIIASRRGFRRKIVAMFPQHHERRADAMGVFQSVRNGVEQYLWIQTVTGLMIAAGSWAIMAVLGLDNAAFWAFLIFIVSYIPIVGGAIGILLPPLFALVQFETVIPAVVLIAVLQAINFVVGNIVLPRMQGDSLNIDPVVVLLSLAFWGAIWGVPGMFLSTPLTVMFMVILAQFKGTLWIAVLLSSDGDPVARASTARRRRAEQGPAGQKTSLRIDFATEVDQGDLKSRMTFLSRSCRQPPMPTPRDADRFSGASDAESPAFPGGPRAAGFPPTGGASVSAARRILLVRYSALFPGYG
jgi:AI-2 transport protein TqsA